MPSVTIDPTPHDAHRLSRISITLRDLAHHMEKYKNGWRSQTMRVDEAIGKPVRDYLPLVQRGYNPDNQYEANVLTRNWSFVRDYIDDPLDYALQQACAGGLYNLCTAMGLVGVVKGKLGKWLRLRGKWETFIGDHRCRHEMSEKEREIETQLWEVSDDYLVENLDAIVRRITKIADRMLAAGKTVDFDA